MFNSGSASLATLASGRHLDYDGRCAPPIPVREYIESNGTRGLDFLDARRFELMRLDGKKMRVRDPMGKSRVTTVGGKVQCWLQWGESEILTERCVGDLTDMPFVPSYEEVEYEKRMDAFLTRSFEAQVLPEFNIDCCLFRWRYE